MNLTIHYRPAVSRTSVFLHAWDQNGFVADVQGTASPDGSYTFTISGTTQDQREISFKYRFGASDWESDTFVRTVPTTAATELWTTDFSARCANQAPGPPATFESVTVHAISPSRYDGGELFFWTAGATGASVPQQARDTVKQTSTFVLTLSDALRAGFYFKLIGKGGDFEPDNANRFWQPSDGTEIWVIGGQFNVRSQEIKALDVDVDFVFPSSLTPLPQLRIQDLVNDFSATLDGSDPASLGADFSTSSYKVHVYPDTIYNIWWTSEHQSLQRRFRIPLEGSGPSIALNGYDHWLPAMPSVDSRVQLTIHPNPGSTFGASIDLDIGIGEAKEHNTVTANKQVDGTWLATISTFSNIPFWAAITAESRPDGPLHFRRRFRTAPNQTLVLHTIDGVGGIGASQPGAFVDAPPALRRALMQNVFGAEIAAANVFDPWEMPHGVSVLDGKTYFVLRAPHAITCSLLLMPNANAAGAPRTVNSFPMSLTNDLRYWWVAVPSDQAPHGRLYRFAYSDGEEILSPEAKLGESLDPASRWVVDSGKLIVDAGSGAEQSWSRVTDQNLIAAAFAGSTWQTPAWDSLLVYEMHVRRFTQRNSNGASPISDFDQVIDELQGGYLSRLPVTALELLPIHEFPGQQSWGYNPSLFFAIDSDYGGPEPLARMVAAAHRASRAVVLDLVYNHMMESALQVIAHDVYTSGETAWGDMVYYAHPAAREFFRQATVYVWKAFQIDAFRFDSTETIVNGGRSDTPSAPFILARGPNGKLKTGAGGGWEFLGILRTALRRAADATGRKWPYLTGENDPENVPMTDPASGVLDGQWRFQEMYALNNAARNQEDHAGDVSNGVGGSARPFFRSVSYAESHDSASGQGGSGRIVAREQFGNGRLMAKAVGAVALLAEGIPMLFMGEEAGEDRAFQFDMLATDPAFVLRLDDYEKQGSEFLQILTWFRDLMGLRDNVSPGFRGDADESLGQGRKTVAFSRAQGRYFVTATFGTGDQQQNLGWLGLPSGAAYKEIFNSSWPQYQVHAEPLIANGGFDAQLHSGDLIHLPSIGAVILERR